MPDVAADSEKLYKISIKILKLRALFIVRGSQFYNNIIDKAYNLYQERHSLFLKYLLKMPHQSYYLLFVHTIL